MPGEQIREYEHKSQGMTQFGDGRQGKDGGNGSGASGVCGTHQLDTRAVPMETVQDTCLEKQVAHNF